MNNRKHEDITVAIANSPGSSTRALSEAVRLPLKIVSFSGSTHGGGGSLSIRVNIDEGSAMWISNRIRAASADGGAVPLSASSEATGAVISLRVRDLFDDGGVSTGLERFLAHADPTLQLNYISGHRDGVAAWRIEFGVANLYTQREVTLYYAMLRTALDPGAQLTWLASRDGGPDAAQQRLAA